MSIPLIALQYADVNVNFIFRSLDECIWANKQSSTLYNSASGKNIFSSSNIPSIKGSGNTYLYVDYIYLEDTDERRRFSQVPHEYLIEQLQFNGNDTISELNNNINLILRIS